MGGCAGERWNSDSTTVSEMLAPGGCQWLPSKGRSQPLWMTHSVFSYKGNSSFIIKQEERCRQGYRLYVCVCLFVGENHIKLTAVL